MLIRTGISNSTLLGTLACAQPTRELRQQYATGLETLVRFEDCRDLENGGPRDTILEQRGAYAQAIEVREMLLRDIDIFTQAERLAGKIPHLTEELEDEFRQGNYVFREPYSDEYRFVERVSGADTIFAHHVPKEQYDAYIQWRERAGFSGKKRRRSPELTSLVQYLGSMGIEVSLGRSSSLTQNQARYLEHLFRMLPEDLLRSGYFKRIIVGASRIDMKGASQMSAYRNGTVHLYSGALSALRRNFLGMLLHEIGHATANRYAVEFQRNNRNTQAPDLRIPHEIRSGIQRSFRLIRDQHQVYAIDWSGGYEERFSYTSGSFKEFIAEFHLIYFVDGAGLRRHIRHIKDPQIRAAYECVYNELKNRVFGGREYGY